MEIHERIKILRKDYCKLTQTAFGDRISITRDMVNNIERGRVEIKDHIIKLICSEFSVNEDWLRTGNGDPFFKTPSSTMEQLKKEFDLDEFSYNLVHEYLELDPKHRRYVRDFFYRVLKSEKSMDMMESSSTSEDLVDLQKVLAEIPDTPEELERKYPPVESNKKLDIG